MFSWVKLIETTGVVFFFFCRIVFLFIQLSGTCPLLFLSYRVYNADYKQMNSGSLSLITAVAVLVVLRTGSELKPSNEV